MRALLPIMTLACLCLYKTAGSGQTGTPQSKDEGVVVSASSAGDSCVFRQKDDIDSHPNCVLQDGHGELFIALEYVKKLEFDSHGLAPVFDEDHSRQGWMYVDRKGRVIVKAVPSDDNWAEEFSDGLVRTVIDKKYGFADRQGRIVIPAKYDGASAFEHGHAVVCMGCRETCAMSGHPQADTDCEHYVMTGGEWFKINKAGRVVARVPAKSISP
jgi:hypothetical protein